MARQTAAQKKAAAAKKAAQAQKAPATTTQTALATTGATMQPAPGATDQTGTTDQAGTTGQAGATLAISLIDQAVAFSMGDLDDEAQAQAAFDLWDLMGCVALPPKLAVAIFDCAHDQGAKVCERLLGKVGITRDEGEYDLSTLEDRDIDELVRSFLAWRLRRYAFTAAAATKMLEWSQHILALQALTITEPEETTQA
jgi:hypothetical protein